MFSDPRNRVLIQADVNEKFIKSGPFAGGYEAHDAAMELAATKDASL